MFRSRRFNAGAAAAIFGAFTLLSACNTVDLAQGPIQGTNAPAVRDAMAVEKALNDTDAMVQTKIVPSIRGTGYATISAQPAKNVNQKRLMAIRVARLDAMRDLTEQVHGMRLDSRTTVIDAVLQNDTTRTAVTGTIRGARTLRINPVGRDTYEVVMELDRDMIARIMKAAR
ncbi:LPP20 family lipoprotein [Planktotalea sp.]|uniref:LPP20 family lipoprotein n=1 Tax=Planktotalea sp. TaxID=2029877 RepID=UPI003F6CB9B8